MRRKTAVIGGIAAGATALALFATPAIASSNNGSVFGMFGRGAGNSTCPMADDAAGKTGTSAGRGAGMVGRGGAGAGAGMGAGNGAHNGAGNGRMMGQGLNLPAKGTLTTDQKTQLAALAEEEKLAHDVYVALAAKYPDAYQFSRIQNAETMHLTALRTLMTRYGITDPTVGKAAGTFSSAAVQDLYNSLIAQATDQTQALAVGVTIEKKDIADLATALKGLTAPDAKQVYTNLQNASQRHLAAFSR